MAEVQAFNKGLAQAASFHEATYKFLEILAENKRLVYLKGIAERYAKLYQQVNKEEKITIISAVELNDSERAEVLAALQQNPQNAGKQFNVDYTIDETIGGGLQMYTETEFKDMSLNSRINHLRNTISKLTEWNNWKSMISYLQKMKEKLFKILSMKIKKIFLFLIFIEKSIFYFFD